MPMINLPPFYRALPSGLRKKLADLQRRGFKPIPPLPAQHPRYALIGRVVAEFAQLEHALDRIIWDIVGINQSTASCFTGQIGQHASKFRTITALLKEQNLLGHLPKDYEKKTLIPLQGRVTFASEERNRIVHDAWFGFPRTRNARQFRSVTSKNSQFGLVAVSR